MECSYIEMLWRIISSDNKKRMKILTANNYEVFESGTVISFRDEPVTFELAADLKIRFVFRGDQDSPETSFNAINPNELEIIFSNFNNPLGAGNTEPIQLGTLNNKALYLSYRILALVGAQGKTIHYSWYLREGVNNG